MRFLKLVIQQGGKGRHAVEFSSARETVLHDRDPGIKNAPDILRHWVTMLNGRVRHGEPALSGNSELFIESDADRRGYKFASINKKITFYEKDLMHAGYSPLHDDIEDPGKSFPGMLKFFSMEELLLLCVHDRELIEQGNDPLYSGRRLAPLLLKKEIQGIGPVFINGIETLTPSVERELNTLSREIQLLELKKMKKDRLKKEMAHASRSLGRLNRQHESADAYRETLLEIKKKGEQRLRLSHKISETKKDLMELRELGDKTGALEKDLKKRFPQFYNEKSDGLPDMDRIQESFNRVRDLNEKIEIYNQKRITRSSGIIKGIAGFVIFIMLSLGFAVMKSLSAGIATVKPLLAAAAVSAVMAAAGTVAVMRIRKSQPGDLIEEKKAREAELLDLLHKNKFPVADFKTVEIYDFLFQYFEDFITFRDIRNELTDLKKRISSTVSFAEKEKKLDSLNEKLEETSAEIERMIAGLDSTVHPVPSEDDMEHTASAVAEQIKELEVKIGHEKAIIAKLEDQLSEQSGEDENLLEIEAEIGEINSRIESLKAEAGTSRFLENTFRDISGPFMERRIAEFTPLLSANVSRLTAYRPSEKIQEALPLLFDEHSPLPDLDMTSKLLLSLAVKSALSEYFRGIDIPPVLLIDPAGAAGRENVEELNKILLELFNSRQVIIFTSGT